MQSIFLFPIALAGLALLALPVIVHLLNRRKAEPLYFPSLRFITASRTTMLRVHRVNNIPLLLLRLLILALIVFAAARPFRIPFVSASQNQQVVILIDSSASVNAKGRWSEAIKQTKSIIDKQPESSRIAVLGFDSAGRVITSLTSRSQAIAGLDHAIASGWRPSGASMNWSEASHFLNAFLSSGSSDVPRVFVVSDFQASNFKMDKSALLVGARVEPVDVHGFDHNLSLQTVSLQKQGDRLKLGAVVVDETKSEKGTESRFNRVGFDVTSASENKPLEFPDAKSGVTLKLLPDTGNNLVGELTGGWADDLESDNTIYFALRRPSPFSVEILRGNRTSDQSIESRKYLSAALSSLPGEQVEKVTESNLTDAVNRTSYRLIVADFKQIIDSESQKALTDFVNGGGHLWLIAPDPADAEFINSRLASITAVSPITSIEREDRHEVLLLNNFDSALGLQVSESVRRTLTSIPINREIKFVASPQSRVLISYADGVPALISRGVGRGEVLVWGLPMVRKSSPLVTDVAFPVLCAGLLTRSNDDPSFEINNEQDDLRFGPFLRSLGQIKGVDKLQGASNTPQNLDSLSSVQPGLYRLKTESGYVTVAINQSTDESHPGTATEAQRNQLFKSDAAKSGSQSVVREKEESERTLWRYLLIGAVILLAGELAVGFYLGNCQGEEVLS